MGHKEAPLGQGYFGHHNEFVLIDHREQLE